MGAVKSLLNSRIILLRRRKIARLQIRGQLAESLIHRVSRGRSGARGVAGGGAGCEKAACRVSKIRLCARKITGLQSLAQRLKILL